MVEREPAEAERFERDIAGDLHVQIARHPEDPGLKALIDELHERSTRFAALWAEPHAARSASSRKTFHHPIVGTITLDCDHLEVVGSDLRLVMWTASPGSPDASALKLLVSGLTARRSASRDGDNARSSEDHLQHVRCGRVRKGDR